MRKRYPPKPRPKTRDEFFQREEELWRELTSCWDGVDEELLTKPGANGEAWSIKDVINHIAAWLEAGNRVVPQLIEGKKATLGISVDTFNDEHFIINKDKSLKLSLNYLKKSRKEFLSILQNAPEPKLLDPNTRIGNWAKYSTYGHYMEHINNLKEFIAENTTL